MVPYKQMPLPYVLNVAYISISFAFFGYNGYLVYGYIYCWDCWADWS